MPAEPARRKIAIALALCFAGILVLGYYLPHTFSAILTSLVIAYLVNPVLKYLEARGFDRVTALMLLYGIGLFAVFIASFFFIPYLGHQLDTLTKSLPMYTRTLKGALEKWQGHMTELSQGADTTWLVNQIDDLTTTLVQELSGQGYRQLKRVAFGAFNLVLAPILVFFMLLYKQHAKDLIKRLFHHADRRHLIDLGRTINRSLERFIIGMIVDCLLVGLLTAGALALLGIEFPVLNGLFAGFASIVPLIGVMVAVIPPTLIGYAETGDFMIVPKVFAAYFVINVIIEGNLIKPLVMRSTLRLNPLAVIFTVMAMGELLGFWGIVLAIPTAAVLKICTAEMRELLVDSKE